MLLSELLNADTIVVAQSEKVDKFKLLENMASYLATVYKLDEEMKGKIKRKILERERSASTCIGKGVAIPHVEVENLPMVMGMMEIIKEPFPYGCPLTKDQMVQIVIMLLFPKGEFKEHILTLAGIAHLMKNDAFRKKIISLWKPDEIFFYILKEEADKLIGSPSGCRRKISNNRGVKEGG